MIDPVALELNNRHQTHPGRRDLVQAIVKQLLFAEKTSEVNRLQKSRHLEFFLKSVAWGLSGFQ